MNKTNFTVVLRLKVFEASLFKSVSRHGSMNPFVEVQWNEITWTSKIAKEQNTTLKWDDFQSFEATEIGPAVIKIMHNNFLLPATEIGLCVISSDELSKGKTKEWIEIFSQGKVVGKIKITVSVDEEKRTDISTQNSSFAHLDLKEEYLRRANELELEKEELEFYRMQYKKKTQKLQQDKKQYKSTLTEIVKRKTPQHTEESSSEEIHPSSQLSGPTAMKTLSRENQKKVMYKTLNNQVALDLQKLRDQRVKGKKKSVKMPSTFGGVSHSYRNPGKDELEELESDTLELKFEKSNEFETPKRIESPCQVNYMTMGNSKSSRNYDRRLFD